MRLPSSPVERTVVDDELRAGTSLFAGLDQHFPIGEIQPLQKQDFHLSAVFRKAENPRGQHARIVPYKQIARFEKIGQIVKMHMSDFVRAAVVYQQAGSVPRLHGRLRDELFGQFVIKIFGSHIALLFPAGKAV